MLYTIETSIHILRSLVLHITLYSSHSGYIYSLINTKVLRGIFKNFAQNIKYGTLYCTSEVYFISRIFWNHYATTDLW